MSSSEASEPEALPPVPFLVRASRRDHVTVLSSSDSDDERIPDVPLLQRLCRPPPLGAAASRPVPQKSVSSRDVSSRPQGAAAQRNPPQQRPASSRDLPAQADGCDPPLRGAAAPGPGKVSQSRKGKKSLDVVTVHIDTVLLQDGSGGQVLSALQAQETPCAIQSQPVPRSITWSRTAENIDGDALCQEEAEIIILVPAEDFVAMVQSSKTETGHDHVTLSSFVARIVANKSCAIPTLVVMELEKYFKNQMTKSRKKLKEAVRGEGAKDKGHKRKRKEELAPPLSRLDVEEAVMVLQLHSDVHVWFLETWKEFSDFVCMFSKAVTEAPIKRQRDNSSFSFYLDGEWAGGVKVDRCGKGLLEAWKRQIQQFNRVSVEVASAVVAVYPSPQLLLKAYQRCQTGAERHNLLSDILVRRGEGVTSTSRRLGPELSKRIYLQLTSSEAELSLDL
ncbi:crossover junction endonuclease EME1 [Bufo gargarizans]|uniref:crossover junction endonuclease EME1 n=1 Tax=Bufo gargarizans TaxID=30331 RepID=UPI001CF5A6C0|nr:crossover junction endonuclease EME1 [Bufo gargarizans]